MNEPESTNMPPIPVDAELISHQDGDVPLESAELTPPSEVKMRIDLLGKLIIPPSAP